MGMIPHYDIAGDTDGDADPGSLHRRPYCATVLEPCRSSCSDQDSGRMLPEGASSPPHIYSACGVGDVQPSFTTMSKCISWMKDTQLD